MHTQFKFKKLQYLILATLVAPQTALAEDAKKIIIEKIEVISTTPLQGIGLPLEQVPANVQIIKGDELEKQKSLSIADHINQNLTGISVNDTQNNPYQPDISFHGYSASPLLGTPQGLSIFVDGVRVNEPFGDVVNWDLISTNSIQNISLIPGSNPLFGLNTLGGALSVQTKSGRTNPGGAVEVYGGSFDRKAASAEFGGVTQDGAIDYFISGNYFDEDGWRDFSPSEVRQAFAKVGWQNETTALNLSYTAADNELIGNGLASEDFLQFQGRESILTRPDITENKLSFVNLNWSHFFNDNVQLSGNTYYRNAKTKTLNGDGNDDFDDEDVNADFDDGGDPDVISPGELASALAECVAGADTGDAEDFCSGAINRTSSKRKGYGFNAQLTFSQDFIQMKNQFITGVGYDYGKTDFNQTSEFGLVNTTRAIDGIGVFNELDDQVQLRGVSKTSSIFATDTLSLNPMWHLTLSGRYNYTKVENKDGFDDALDANGDPVYSDPINQSLTSNQSFNRFNPAIGVNYTPTKALTAYASYNEGSRAPTAIELGCANPLQPCKLPNAFAGDPPLDQVVAKTYEGGLRGRFSNEVKWSLAAYRAQNTSDIQFINADSNGAGFFDNVGKTRRIGLDAAINGDTDRFSWTVGYSYVRATYESDFLIANEVNSSAIDTNGDGDEDSIQVGKGDRLPGIPQHQLKLRAAFDVTPYWNVGTNIYVFSDVYSRGNENNDHNGNGAKVAGYAVVNLDTRYNFGSSGWQVFAKATNIFDREFSNGGLLGEHRFDATSGLFTGNEVNVPFYAVGAPRAAWVGVRYEFGGAKKSAAAGDND